MKKSILAAAALGLAGAASAQSSVTLFGIVDVNLARGSGSLTDKTQLTNSGYNSSRLGFRGVEDLGGGLRAFRQRRSRSQPRADEEGDRLVGHR